MPKIKSREESGDHPSEKRKSLRFKYHGTIMLSEENFDYYSYAQVGNVSGDGMYIELDHAFARGTEIGIRFDNPPFKSAPKYYSATVQWCKPVSRKGSTIPFGMGVKFL